MSETWSYSLVESTFGGLVAHAPDCPAVRALADGGVPVATLIDCNAPLPLDIPRHSCLDGGTDDARVQ